MRRRVYSRQLKLARRRQPGDICREQFPTATQANKYTPKKECKHE